MSKNMMGLKCGGKFVFRRSKMYIILVYDISMDANGSKVLNRVYKICKKYLTHIQNSTFKGELSKVQIIKLKRELDQFIRDKMDSVIIFKSRNERWLEKEFWGMVICPLCQVHFEKKHLCSFIIYKMTSVF